MVADPEYSEYLKYRDAKILSKKVEQGIDSILNTLRLLAQNNAKPTI